MLLIQMTGLSGAGKSTIAEATQKKLTDLGYKVELLDGDDYRKHLCPDAGRNPPCCKGLAARRRGTGSCDP